MDNQDKNICQQAIEAIINSNVNEKLDLHIRGCSECRQMADTISALKKHDSAFGYQENLNLKKRVINRILPIIQATENLKKGPAANEFSWKWLFAAALTAAFFFSINLLQQPQKQQTDNLQQLPIVARDNSATFDISVNGKAFVKASMDNPVSLFNNETAIINLGQDSTISISGPARLTVQPKGFHLLSGKATATVKPGSGNFTATTVHGRIEVLGTIFSCETSPSGTIVSVERGRVKVSDNSGKEKILSAGEKIQIGQNDNSSGKEGIPLISKE